MVDAVLLSISVRPSPTQILLDFTARHDLSTSPSVERRTPPAWPALLLGLAGLLFGLALPFAPVWAETTTVTWPAPGAQAQSASAIVVPYRPIDLTASIPCAALRSGAPGEVLATGTGSDGLIVTTGPGGAVLTLDGRRVALSLAGDCGVVVTAGRDGVTVVGGDGRRTDLPDQPVPKVFGFRTGLAAPDAAGLTVTATIADPFGTSPGAVKIGLIVAQLMAAGGALVLLYRASQRPVRVRRRLRWRRAWWVDAGVVAVFAGWAVIGPLAVDDGWATTIARTFADTGSPGNYYRWWNAAEVPFALGQQLLAPLTEVSLAPLWLRLPSTVCAIATWFVLSRGVLGAALPVRAGTTRIRLLAAVFLLVTWLPFNLGARPESYVALGITVVLAFAMRSRNLAGLGGLVLAAALTVPISPNGVLILAPVVVFAPRLLTALRSGSPTRMHLLAHALLLSCVGAIGLTIVFGDQSWDALTTATDWHTYFGPSVPWYEEAVRYEYLLQTDQQGSFAKRMPVLLSVAMLPIVALLAIRGRRDVVGRSAARVAAVTLVALLLFAIAPSKWSYHLGAAAGLFAALLTMAVVLVLRRARTPDRYRVVVGIAGSALVIAALAVAFDGPNAWWLPAVYDVPWATEPPRPLGVPLNHPLVWLGLLVVLTVAVSVRRRGTWALVAGPALLVCTACGVVLALLLGSFATAPLRQPAGSLALANLNRITGAKACGLADDVELLPDGPVLAAAAEPGESLTGFVARGGYPPDAPPPEPPGTGASASLWGSTNPTGAEMTSPWFVLPPQEADGGVALSVSGRTDGENRLTFEFGRSEGTTVSPLGEQVPPDRPASDEDPDHPLWRTIGVDATDVPAGADRVRIRALADVRGRTDGFDWLAFTGPRLRSVVALNQFLADNGPVLVGWPQSFLFPCVRDIARVAGGIASTPRTVIESPRPWFVDDRKRDIGGTFGELEIFGDLREIPSRLRGAPDVDWGSVLVSGDTAARDAYQRTVRRELVPGAGGTAHQKPER